jgi:hypothetical protein
MKFGDCKMSFVDGWDGDIFLINGYADDKQRKLRI